MRHVLIAAAILAASPASADVRNAWPYVRSQCLPTEIRNALSAISAHFKRDVLIVSAHRASARGSMHAACRAADIRVPGADKMAVRAFAATLPGIRGVGTYPRKDLIHIDNRSIPFAWRR